MPALRERNPSSSKNHARLAVRVLLLRNPDPNDAVRGSLTGADTDAVTADRNRCQSLPTAGWHSHSFAYFRFGDLDVRSQQQLRALDGRQSKMGAHMADVVQNALDEGVSVGNASLWELEAREGTLGARFSLVLPLTSRPGSATDSELVVHRISGPTS